MKDPQNSSVVYKSYLNLEDHLSKEFRYVIITDKNVEKLYAKRLKKKLAEKGFNVILISIVAAEESKNRETKHLIENQMTQKNLGKDTCIIGMGGGVVLDLSGFVAATYCRGVPFLSIPTTLLAMVDASIGGKTAVNAEGLKNFIGTYYPAELILIDFSFLKTLSEIEMKNGFAEIIKYGLIASNDLFKKIEKIDLKDLARLKKIIRESILIKQKIVFQDPFEQGLRHILNFGHTIGHVLESYFEYKISHGLAVALGMAFESYLSFILGYLSEAEFNKILQMLMAFDYPVELFKKIPFNAIIKGLKMDKKSLKNAPRFVLLKKIGKTVIKNNKYCHMVDIKYLRKTYEHF
ncbi:MAG: 3-dehydroquinate synthase [Chlamydiae bacterium]|nr:3-dehydroquinate synthase [Chlamydiota bacterium]